METREYAEVNIVACTDNYILSRKSFMRQLLVFSVPWTFYFAYGLCMGAPTVFIPQIRRDANSTEVISDEMASWLTAVLGYGSVPWALVLAIVTEIFGRKKALVFLCMNVFVAFIIFYTSNTVIQLLISELIESIMGAAFCNITIMVITEYTSPKHRGFFLTFKSATVFWGIWASNAIGTFFHWRFIGIVKLVCSIYPLVIVFYIPESPYWLASKGKFDKCIESHRWLKGRDDNSELELRRLIDSEKNYLTVTRSETFSMSRTVNIVLQKEFYVAMLLTILISSLYYLSGKSASSFYSLDIIKEMTASESTAYMGMLILDGATVFAMYVGSFLSKYFRRRTLLLLFSSIGILFLFLLSLYIYLVKLSYITESHYVSILLLMSYSMSICWGPMIMAPCFYAELLPLRHRSLFVCITAIFDKSTMGTVVKILPLIIQKFGLESAFFLLGFLSTFFLVLLYKYLPETKDKTIQEINDEMAGAPSGVGKEATRFIAKDTPL